MPGRLAAWLATYVLAAMCLLFAAGGFAGMYFLLNGGNGVLPDAVLYFLTGAALVWCGVWLFLLATVIEQAIRRR
jgi:hypothetical protein